MAGPDAKGRATSVLLGGITLACVAGVPAGAALGHALGWRWAFWAVALLCLPAVVAVVRSVPETAAGAWTVLDGNGERCAARGRWSCCWWPRW
ncbi:MFS transporter [Actinomadura spongiicola]|uniref:MFS transporter n=1 Tax=Actinomadura spongiicola TaxID=2303421 RepID=A0A372GAC0_9ACTN|nr:MFS transporter [Actinomadura spongiicola]RFS82310.1 MFS transporter [Actinomadura spongiicola]